MIYIYVLLLRIVAYLEGPAKIIAFLVVFGLMSFSTLNRIPFAKLHKITKYNYYALIISVLVIVHGLIFGKVYIKNVAVILTYWIWFVFTYNYFSKRTIRQALFYLLMAFLIFNAVDFLYFKLYFADQKIGINRILGYLGIHGYRIYFPLASGANVYAAQLALCALVVLYFVKTSSKKFLYIAIYAFYILMLVLVDSRLILLFTFLFSLVYWFSLKTIIEFCKKFWWALGLLLFGFLFVFYSTDYFDAVKRPGELEGRALSRIEIWSKAFEVIFSDLRAITGHGLNGFEENMKEAFKEVFQDQHLQTSHNFIIQNIIDFGLFGIVIILYLVFEILKITVRLRSQIITILIVMLLFMGITESIPTFYSFEATLFFIATLSIILTQNERKTDRLFEDSKLLS